MLTKGTYVIAVSGGVDSMVLLDMLVHDHLPHSKLIVAHFDHGIRDDSADDAAFVAKIAARYTLPFETTRVELGAGASEAAARQYRYDFLRGVAARYDARIVTAHHADDVVETVAINCIRGTGWRGLAVMDSADVLRPLIGYRKKELITYAAKHELAWREDSTNTDEAYLRNKLRKRLTLLGDDEVQQILALHAQQIDTKHKINHELTKLITQSPYDRYMFTMVEHRTAIEMVQWVAMQNTGMTLLTTQLGRVLHAIKTAKPGSRFDAGQGSYLEFTRTHFVVKTTQKMIL